MLGSGLERRLSAIEGNSHCADCGCRSPRWASVNLGVLLCINCSGVHRKLGVHLSTVKSLSLDNIRPEWIKVLSAIGNDTANRYYLHRLPAHAAKPSQSTSAYDMEIWIRNKYERKVYAIEGLDEPYVLLEQGYNPRDVIMKYSKGALKAEPDQPPQVNQQASVSSVTSLLDMDNAKPTIKLHEDLFQKHKKNDICFDAFGDNAPASSWAGDFWPSGSVGTSGRGVTEGAPWASMPSKLEMQQGTSETRLEAAKDTITKLFNNPESIGFKDASYPQNKPSSVNNDIMDIHFGDLYNKINQQKKHNNDLI